MKKIFAAEPSYHQMIQEFDKTDAYLAIGVYVFVILSYLGIGYLRLFCSSIVPSILVNILLIVIVLGIVHIRKQKISTVGITLYQIKRALIFGTVTGFILSVCGNILPTVLSGGQWTGFGSMIWNFFYMLIVIAFTEELVFRGYIQPRLYGVIKSDVLATIAGGLMFMGMHIPFQLFNRSGGNIIEFFAANSLWLFSTILIHLLFQFLYRKFNSLTAPVICHFLMNFGSTLFQ